MFPCNFRLAVFIFLSVILFCFSDFFGQSFVFIPFDQTIPDEVAKAREESLVAIRIITPHLHPDQEIYYDHAANAVGFASGNNYVVTALHILGERPALWFNNANYPTVVEVFDGLSIFSAKAAFWSYKADLLLLKVESPNKESREFKQKPAKLAPAIAVQDPDTKKLKVVAEKFFAFSFFSLRPMGFFSLQTGPVLTVTNFVGDQMLEIPMGIVQTAAEPGFSGGPLLAPDGTVVGLVTRSSTAYSYFVLSETVVAFLEVAKKKIALDNKTDSWLSGPP